MIYLRNFVCVAVILISGPVWGQLSSYPSMLGDGFFIHAPVAGNVSADRLLYLASDLDAPGPLPPVGSMITIAEAGPVGLFSSSATSIQDIQAALRTGQPLPSAVLIGQIAESATMTTTMTVAQVQALLAGTAKGFDVVSLAAPPVGYNTGAQAAFEGRVGPGGTAVFDQAGSGALLQGGDDNLDPGDDFDAFYFFKYQVNLTIDSPHAAALRSGILKIANGGSPLPIDRVYFDYSLFTNVGFAPATGNVNRFVPGIERSFFDGIVSIEVRAPFSSATSSDLTASGSGVTNHSRVEWGDVTTFTKVLLIAGDNLAISGGIGVTLPTAHDITVTSLNGTPLLALETESVHIGPFLGALYAPNPDVFVQGFLQLDFDANGNRVLANNGSGLVPIGRLRDPGYLFANIGVGYWITPPDSGQLGKSVIAELHYNGSLGTTHVVQQGQLQVGDTRHINTINAVVGGSVQLADDAILTAGYVAPLGSNSNRQVDGGLRVNLEYRPR